MTAQTDMYVTCDSTLWGPFIEAIDTAGLVLARIPGASQFRFRVAEGALRRPVGENLTDREMQVLVGMSWGKSDSAIARELELSPHTVKSHNRRLFRKLGAHDRAHAVHIAHLRGILGGVS